jgi:hypothetical protein
LNWLAENDRNAYKSAAGMLATRRKLRPIFVERKPRDERNQWIKDSLARPANADLALEILQVWTLGCNERMVCDFLDQLGIAHNGKGLIDELPPEARCRQSCQGRRIAGFELPFALGFCVSAPFQQHGFTGLVDP